MVGWAAGAVTESFVWFFTPGFVARLLRPLFACPNAWRVPDLLIAAAMLTLGVPAGPADWLKRFNHFPWKALSFFMFSLLTPLKSWL